MYANQVTDPGAQGMGPRSLGIPRPLGSQLLYVGITATHDSVVRIV
jgi:hypothetical protein